MQRVLRRGSQTIQLLPWYENPTADTLLEFRDPSAALDYLRTFMDDPLSMMTLRDGLAEELAYTDIAGLDDQEVLEQLAWRLVDGHVKIAPFAPSEPVIQAGIPVPAAPEVEEEQAAPAAVEQRTSWIAIELVDEEGSPVAGETYRIVLPDGSIREGQLDANGQARVDDIEPGTCQVSFPELSTASEQSA